jgi:hypothetical protein
MAGVGIYADVTGHSTSVPFSGIAVGARGWSSPDREQKGAKMKDDPDDIPMAYLLYVVLGILLLVAGAIIFIIRMFLAFQSPSMPGK